MELLPKIIDSNEEWLMERILMYAEKTGYTAYTSTLKEAWRLSISGLSQSIIEATKLYSTLPEFTPDFDFVSNPIAQFGIIEAQKHRKRGISLVMFMGLMKYYRQAYMDLLDTCKDISSKRNVYTRFLSRVFDIIEISFCSEWSGGTDDQIVRSMQTTNMLMTNEKNKYLTIFESLPNPVFLVSQDGFVDNMNIIAATFFNSESVPGGHYYNQTTHEEIHSDVSIEEEVVDTRPQISNLMPWLNQELQDFKEGKLETNPFIKKTIVYNKEYKFNVRISAMLDVSHKFSGMVLIIEDITKMAATESEMQKLAGLIPICSHCNKIRDDQGYWNKLERYIEERSEALFSHSICQSCAEKYYKEYIK